MNDQNNNDINDNSHEDECEDGEYHYNDDEHENEFDKDEYHNNDDDPEHKFDEGDDLEYHKDHPEEEHQEPPPYNDDFKHQDYWDEDPSHFDDDQKSMSLGDHLEELRRVFFRCLIIVASVSVVAAFFYKEIFHFLMQPVLDVLSEGEELQSGIADAFSVMVKGVVLSAVTVSLPFLINQIWSFSRPGLKKKEQRFLVYLMTLGTIFFIAGLTMAYKFVVPITISFFKSFNEELGSVNNLFYVGQSMSYVINIMLVFGIAFETPLVVMGLVKTGIVELETLKSIRKYVLFTAVIGGAVLTPPDPMSQVLLACTLYGLYEIGMLLGRFGISRRDEQE